MKILATIAAIVLSAIFSRVTYARGPIGRLIDQSQQRRAFNQQVGKIQAQQAFQYQQQSFVSYQQNFALKQQKFVPQVVKFQANTFYRPPVAQFKVQKFVQPQIAYSQNLAFRQPQISYQKQVVVPLQQQYVYAQQFQKQLAVTIPQTQCQQYGNCSQYYVGQPVIQTPYVAPVVLPQNSCQQFYY